MPRTSVSDGPASVKGMTRTRVSGSVLSSVPSIAPGGAGADAYEASLAEAHAEIANLSPTAAAELLLCLTVDVRRLDAASLARVRLAAIKLAREIAQVAA